MFQVNVPDAVKRFLGLPELLERLFSMLDLEATLNLAHVVGKEKLTSSLTSMVWKILIRDFCPKDDENLTFGNSLCHSDSDTDSLLEFKAVLMKFVAILKLMKGPRVKVLLLDLLYGICDRFPHGPPDFQLQMSCPRHPHPHCVSPAGLILLDEVEKAMGTTELGIKSSQCGAFSEPILFAILSMMSRQKDAVTSVTMPDAMHLASERVAQAYCSFMKSHAQDSDVQVSYISIEEPIGEVGWKAVANVVLLRPGIVGFITCTREDLAEANEEDLQNIWQAVRNFTIYHEDGKRYLNVRDPDWDDALDRILEMSEEKFSEILDLYGDEEEESDSDAEEFEDEMAADSDSEEQDEDAAEDQADQVADNDQVEEEDNS